jgi:hypothetical protein
VFQQLIAGGLLAVSILTAAGCGSPFLQPVANSATWDPGLVGEWTASDPVQARVVIAQASGEAAAGGYTVSLTVHDKGEFKTALNLDLTLSEVGSGRYLDLFLSQPERDKLVGAYGFLAIPVHQVMKMERDGDKLTVRSFRGDFLEAQNGPASIAHDRIVVGGGDVVIVTAPTEQVKDLLSQHADDPLAFGDPIVFHRVKN